MRTAHLPNTGLYEWKIPDLRGRVQFRISVTDQAGNYSFADSAELEITGVPDPTGQGLPPLGKCPVQRVPLPGARLSADQMHRLNQLLKTGAGLQDEHNDAGAIVKFREALAIDPQHPMCCEPGTVSIRFGTVRRDAARLFGKCFRNRRSNRRACSGWRKR